MKDFEYFDWRWDDEPVKHEYQLVIPRENLYGKFTYHNNQFVQVSHNGRKFPEECKYFLKRWFVEWYNHADEIDIEPFLDYQLDTHQGDKVAYIKYLRASIRNMLQTNEWELDFKSKRETGVKWADEKLSTYKPDVINREKRKINGNTLGKTSAKYSFENVFKKGKISPDQFLELLITHGFINDNYEWLGKKSDISGLMIFLIENDYTYEKDMAPLYKVLSQKIKNDKLGKPDRKVYGDYVDQYLRVFPPPAIHKH